MQTFLPVNSVCIGYHTTSRSIFNLFARVCFSKKYQTGKNTPEQNSSTKHPHNGIRSTQHLNQVSRATSKWPMKICGTWLVVKQFYCFFANHSGSFSENWIIFPRFCTLFTYRLFTVPYFLQVHRVRPLYITGGHHISWICIKSTFSPPSPRINPTHAKPRLDLETALLLSANQIQ